VGKRKLSEAPTAAEIAAVTCPFRRVELINEVADTYGTVPGPLAAIRREALVALKRTYSHGRLAQHFARSRSWVYRLTRTGQEQP
jgi:hypothetical protein